MKRKGKILALLSSVLVIITLISSSIFSFALSANDFSKKLDSFKTKRYKNNSTYVDNMSFGGWQCFGFANEVASYIFGSYPTTSSSGKPLNKGWKITYGKNGVKNLAVGDIVRFFGHSIFVTNVLGDNIIYCQANVPDGTNKVTYNNHIKRSDLEKKVDSLRSEEKKSLVKLPSRCGWVAHCKKGVPSFEHVHTFLTTTKKATTKKNGEILKKCTFCGFKKSTTIKKIKSIALKSSTFSYTAKPIAPTVIIKDSSGKTLKNGTDFSVSGKTKATTLGTHKIKVTLKGKYSASKSLSYKIILKKPNVKVTKKSNHATLKWDKIAGAKRYEIFKSSDNKAFKKVLETSNTQYTEKIPGSKKHYYFKVRAKNGKALGAFSSKIKI